MHPICPARVEAEVPAQPGQGSVFFHRDSLVPALKEMAGSLPFVVCTHRAGVADEPHDLIEIFTRRLEDRVTVIRHQHAGMEDQFKLFRGSGDTVFELPVIGLREKFLPSVVSPRADMADCAFILHTQGSGYFAPLAKSLREK